MTKKSLVRLRFPIDDSDILKIAARQVEEEKLDHHFHLRVRILYFVLALPIVAHRRRVVSRDDNFGVLLLADAGTDDLVDAVRDVPLDVAGRAAMCSLYHEKQLQKSPEMHFCDV